MNINSRDLHDGLDVPKIKIKIKKQISRIKMDWSNFYGSVGSLEEKKN